MDIGPWVDGKKPPTPKRFAEGPLYAPVGVKGPGVEAPLMGEGVRE
jgi:hypothetical protein